MRKTALALLLATACVVRERVPPPPPPYEPPAPAPQPVPPPPPQPQPQPPQAQPAPPPSQPAPMDERSAVRVATDFARHRGLHVERYKARLDARGNWRVDLRSDRGGDRARVLVDGRTGKVLRAKLHEADDWDD